MPLWKGRFQKELDKQTNDFNASISFDSRMAQQDIRGSIAHATMLGRQGIIDEAESGKIVAALRQIALELESGKLAIDRTAEDIHTFVEAELTKRIGDSGKRLHTARSRNDQVALDLRLYLLDESEKLEASLNRLLRVITAKAKETYDFVMPGYTHLQRAQPITFGHHLLAYGDMLLRDRARLQDCKKRMAVSPLGSGALAGTTYPLDRGFAAAQLGLTGVSSNSLDGVSDRDYVLEFLSALSIMMMHLSRFSEEIITWNSNEYGFIELDDA
ncbi:MAG: argininosuccinate lyase, partial [Clostridia bacterium]|nr:argininosuccinate lyase [Clostridia bacterium]